MFSSFQPRETYPSFFSVEIFRVSRRSPYLLNEEVFLASEYREMEEKYSSVEWLPCSSSSEVNFGSQWLARGGPTFIFDKSLFIAKTPVAPGRPLSHIFKSVYQASFSATFLVDSRPTAWDTSFGVPF